MALDEQVRAVLGRFEIVEWAYDGLNGRIIPWTKEHGGTSDDPSAQAFVLDAEGQVLARAADATAYQAAAFARWLGEQADLFERSHPATKMPFVRARVVAEGEGEQRTFVCALLDEARAANRPALLYFGREEREGASPSERHESKAARRCEKGTLDSQKAADECAGVTLLRFDLSQEEHAGLAGSLGVTKAPSLLLLLPGAERPEVLSAGITGASLAYRLKKLREGR